MEMKAHGHYSTGPPQPVIRRERTVNSVLVAAVVLSVAVVVLLAVAVGTDFWLDNGQGSHMGMWITCQRGQGCRVRDSDLPAIRIYRGMVLGPLAASVLAVVLISLALCHISPRSCAACAGTLLILSSLALVVLVLVFLYIFIFIAAFSGGRILRFTGYSFTLAAVGTGLAFVTGILACVGACVERSDRVSGVIIAP